MKKDKNLANRLNYLIIAAVIIGSTLVSQNQTSSQVARLNGIDVSGHQHPPTIQHPEGQPIDWPKVYGSGQRFAFVKSTEGTHYINKHFRTDIEQGRNAGVLMAIYHFARPVKNTATEEARFFIEVTRPYLTAGYLRPVLDVEDVKVYGEYPCRELGKEKLSAWIHEWTKTVEIETGIKPILYLNSNYARNCLNGSLTTYNLWIAHWKCNPDTSPKTGVWNNWDFWQYYAPEYCGRNYIPGIGTAVDLDVFNGDLPRAYTFTIAPTINPPPQVSCPPQGEPKFSQGQEVITTDDGLRVREKPSLAAEIIKTQLKGTSGKILEGPVCADNYVWWKVEYENGTIGWSAQDWLEVFRVSIEIPTPTVQIPTPLLETPTPTPTITPGPPITEIRGKIAFVSNRDGNAEIYLMNADGTNQINLTNHPAGDWDPAWSPDGKKIAFVSDRDGDAEIYVMNSDGSNPIQLTTNSAKDVEPDWSPDGQFIIFASDRDGNDEIYIMNSNGSNQRNLTNFPGSDQSPRWSPDGRKIVFTSEGRGEYPWNVFPLLHTMNPDGTGISRLSGLHGGFLERPMASDWSANGKYIAFSSIDEGIGGYSEMELYEIESDYVRLIGEFLGQDLAGSFSPDSKWLSFASKRNNENWEIYLLNFAIKEIRRLTENKADDWDPAWSW